MHAKFVKDSGMLTLSEAVKSGRLQDFIAQEEARGIGSIERSELDRTLAACLRRRLNGSAGTSGRKYLAGQGPG
jgi:hypothetical protein